MRTFLFAVLAALIVLCYHVEAQRNCPNFCTTKKRAKRQCRSRRGNCKLVKCRRGRKRRACVPIIDPESSMSPSPSPSSSMSPTPSSSSSPSVSSTPSSSPSVSPSPSVSSTPSMTPSSSATPSPTPSITPSPSPTPIVNVLSDVRGVSCPTGTSPGPFGGDSCDLTSLRVTLDVGPGVRLGFPPRANCPNSPVAGGGQAGCTLCGDDTSNTVRELSFNMFNGDAGCTAGLDLTRRLAEYIEATAVADGVDLCARDFDVDDGGLYITSVLASKFPDIMNAAFCSPNPTFINRLSDVRGVSCPPGTSPGPFGGDSCDLTSLRVTLDVGPGFRFGFPPRANCPNSPVAGGGQAGCTLCGDDTSNNVRELTVNMFNGNAGCAAGTDLSRRIGDSIEATASEDGVDLCPREFVNDDGGPYITIILKSKFQDVLNDAFCV